MGQAKPFQFTVTWKSLILVGIAMAMIVVPSYGYYSNIYLPSFPNPIHNPYDPFTLLWNGTTTSSGPHLQGIGYNDLCTGSVACVSTSFTTAGNDVLFMSGWPDQGNCVGPTISDSQGNTWTHYTAGNWNTATSTTFGYYTVTSQSGTDAVTWTCSLRSGYTVLDYTGVNAIGNEADNNAGNAGSDTQSISISQNSVVVEVGFGLRQNSACGTLSLSSPNLEHTATECNQLTNGFSELAKWADSGPYGSSGTATETSTQSFMATLWHSVVEIKATNQSANLCPPGYNCLFSQLDSQGHVQLNAKPSTPTVLDSFHPSPVTSMYNAGNGTSNVSFFAQTFTIAGASWQIGSVQFLMNQTNTWTGGWVAQIWNINGTAGVNGSPKGSLPNSGNFPAGVPLASSALFTGPLTSVATATTFTFSDGPVLSPGSYVVSLTDNSTIAPGASPLIGAGTGLVNTLVSIQFGDGNPAYAGHNVYLPRTGMLIRATKAFWFTVNGATTSAVALTNAPIDVSTSASKELLFYETWHNTTAIVANQPWGWYLTTNSTLPTTANYNPLNDSSVALADVVYPAGGSSNIKNYYSYQSKTPGEQLLATSGLATNPYPGCSQASTLYECDSGNSGYSNTQFFSISSVLNYTGSASGALNANNGASIFCVDTPPGAGSPTNGFCSSQTSPPTINPCTGQSQQYCVTYTLPFLNINGGPFYLGFWSSAGQTGTILFGTSLTGGSDARANSVWYWVPNPTTATTATTAPEGFLGFLGHVIGGAFSVAGNTLGSLFGPGLNFLGSGLSAVASGIVQMFGLVAQGYVVLLNSFGNLVGLGNVGTDLANFFIGAANLLTEGIAELITGLSWIVALLARSANVVTIITNASGAIFTLALNGLTGGVNGVTIILTLLYWTFLGVSLLFTTLEILLFFLLVGDYGGAGFHAWFETSKWFIFGTGLKFMVLIFNFGLDVISAIISVLPKPIIQMSGIARWPRLPIWDVTGSPTLPDGQMEAARNGNLFTIFGWIIGAIFTFSYESTTLPGSIAGFVPGAASEVAPIAMSVNIGYIVLFLSGALLMFLLPAQLANAFPILDSRVPGRGFKLSARGPQVSVGSVSVMRRQRDRGRLARFAQRRLEAKRVIKGSSSSENIN